SGSGVARDDVRAPGDVVLELRPNVSITDFNQAYHTSLIAQIPGTSIYRLALPAGVDVNTFLQSVSADARAVSTDLNHSTFQPEAQDAAASFQWIGGFNGDGPLAYQGQ